MRRVRVGVRVRLTALVGGLFLLAAALLLGFNYLLVSDTLADRLMPGGVALEVPPGPAEVLARPPFHDTAMVEGRIEQATSAAREATLDRLVSRSLLALAFFTVVAGLLGWLVAGRVLAPVHAMTATARRLSTQNLHERIALDGPDDELKELADTFDAMLDRLDASFDSQRRFVANASHELRTPLAIQRTLLEVALADPNADLRHVAGLLLGTNERSERLVDGLLLLARAERGVATRQPFDLGALVREVTDQHRAEAAERGVTLHVDGGAATVRGERVLVERLVVNLVQNALRHNVSGGSAWVSVRDTAVVVENTGPVVPGEEVAALFEPFRRYGAERVVAGGAAGVGLGLSIVRSVATAHDATLSAVPREGGGLTVTVTFAE
ncbi:MAG TPA: ATP-binding protein [Frankiaceae bacterium]|nr:ATP-binding protein [Frankiaceae bacterium]